MSRISLLIFLILMIETSFAGGSASPFTRKQMEGLVKISKQVVQEDPGLLIYHGLVYNMDKLRPNGPIPEYHKSIFEGKKLKDSLITDEDVGFHNGKLKKFLSDFENVVGVVQE